jgi:chaperonin GroEL
MIKPKKLYYNKDAREKLLSGINKVAEAVKVTMGAMGRTVVIGLENGNVQVTKDGVTVARSIHLEDTAENMAATLIKQAAEMTLYMAGDGTTTATLLTQILSMLALNEIDKGVSHLAIKKEIEHGVKKAVDLIRQYAHPVKEAEDIEMIATISANNDKEIGSLIAQAMKAVNMDGEITVQDNYGRQTTVETVEGMSINAGYVSGNFVTNQRKKTAELNNPYVLIYDMKIVRLDELLPILEKVVTTGRELLILCENMEGEALNTTVVNHLQGKLKVCVCKLPQTGMIKKDLMMDVAMLTGAKIISHEYGLSLRTATLEHLGTCERVEVGQYNSTFLGGGGKKEDIEDRKLIIREQMEQEDNDMVKEVYRKRLSNLTNGVAIIKVGGYTPSEIGEKKDRIDDALKAAKAAIEEGYIYGGGSTAYCIGKSIGGLVGLALQAPMNQILTNAGLNTYFGELHHGTGFNAITGELVNMKEHGIIDSAKVLRVALENAASVALMVLSTECLID